MYDWTKEANAIDSLGLPISAGMGGGAAGSNEKGREVREYKDGNGIGSTEKGGNRKLWSMPCDHGAGTFR